MIIDVVILWVDGADKKHQLKMLPYLEEKSSLTSKKFRNRYYQVNEIKFCIDSIIKFAPYVRNIFVVTDNQTPKFLCNNNNYKKVSIIDHSTIFKGYEQYLPVFNSRAIESFIFKIPNLAEHFIYFNDDFFLINKTKPSDFFKNGYPVLRGSWKKYDEHFFYKKHKKNKTGHKIAQQKSAKVLGFKNYYRFKHTPHPYRKSTFEDFYNSNKNIFKENIKYKFRNKNQYLIQGIINHLEIKNKSCFFKKDLNLLYFRSYKKPLLWYKIKLNFKNEKKLFLGLQSLDKCKPVKLKYILKWLQNRTS